MEKPKGYSAEIRESERPSYLEAHAKKISGEYGLNIKDAKMLLCTVWDWDPKKYIKNQNLD